ncbi:Alpha/Beta hydrolase protein [Kalaharituber pfeilii]|nr:Alpha/Beta hydrolase protein [Kalaharituber pfeilii]
MVSHSSSPVAAPPQAPPAFASDSSASCERKKRWHESFTRPRWLLHIEAAAWRQLSNIGFFLHRIGPPVPALPSFSRSIPITVSSCKEGEIVLTFWTPEGYKSPAYPDGIPSAPGESASTTTGNGNAKDQATKPEPSNSQTLTPHPKPANPPERSITAEAPTYYLRYPFLINFHGGGFTLGTSLDDIRWAHTTTTLLNCIFVSVEYRLAPQHPFPTAVEDGADATLWLVDNADLYALDPNRIVTTGFSAGGNMAFTVPMRVRDEISRRRAARGLIANPITRDPDMNGIEPGEVLTEPPTFLPPSEADHKDVRDGHIIAVASFYPSADFTLPREVRRLSILRKDKSLPAFFTDLFDASYLHPPKSIALDDKYLSPGIAPTDILRDSLPEDIIIYTCEWDELLVEGEQFAKRLASDEIGKSVRYRCIMGARHGWDKSPLPWQGKDERRDGVYREVCNELGKVLYGAGWRDLGGSHGSGSAEANNTKDIRRLARPQALLYQLAWLSSLSPTYYLPLN